MNDMTFKIMTQLLKYNDTLHTKKVMKTEVRLRFCRKFLGRFWHVFVIKDGTAQSETKLPLFGEHQS